MISAKHSTWSRSTGLSINRGLIHSRMFYGVETVLNRDGLITILAPSHNRKSENSTKPQYPNTPAMAAGVEAGIPAFCFTISIFKRALSVMEKTSGNDCLLLQIARELFMTAFGTNIPVYARFNRIDGRPCYVEEPIQSWVHQLEPIPS